MSTETKLTQVKFLIESILEDFNEIQTLTPEKTAIHELIRLVKRLNAEYLDWCLEMDDEFGYPHGTTYEEGTCLEYYIESTDMHDLSKIIRKLS